MGRRRATNGDECDAFSRRSRRLIAAFSRAGVASKTKRRARRRERHEARLEIRNTALCTPYCDLPCSAECERRLGL